MLEDIMNAIRTIWRQKPKTEVVGADPADFIVETFVEHRPSFNGDRRIYRIRHWMPVDGRYYFEGDFLWLDQVNQRLRELGVEDPTTVPVVPIDAYKRVGD